MKNRGRKIFITNLFILCGFLLFSAGTAYFLTINAEIINAKTIIIPAVAIILVTAFVFLCITIRKREKNSGIAKVISLLLAVAALTYFVIVFVNNIVINMFQPLTLTTLSVILLSIGAILMFLGGIFGIISRKLLCSCVASVTLIVILSIGVIWGTEQGFASFENIEGKPQYIFENGEGGYYTFRIPSLLSINRRTLNEKYGFELQSDILLATAEGRKNSSRDVGDIDIVGKISLDSGKTWSKLYCLFSLGEGNGKVGNPTVVFDKNTGLVNLICQIGTRESGYDYRTYNYRARFKDDFTLDFCYKPVSMNGEIKEDVTLGAADGVNENTVMAGPGKAIQLFDGRLIVPCSNQGYSFVMYSDDGGESFVRSENACAGNECEVTEMSDGRLCMVSRENKNCSGVHNDCYIRLSFSNDGGESWYEKGRNTILSTPICMTSIDSVSDSLVVTFPDSHLTRANLSVATSFDDGFSWKKKRLYNGASGYSCVTVDSENNIFVLAEIGKLNYNECLVFLKIAM